MKKSIKINFQIINMNIQALHFVIVLVFVKKINTETFLAIGFVVEYIFIIDFLYYYDKSFWGLILNPLLQ